MDGPREPAQRAPRGRGLSGARATAVGALAALALLSGCAQGTDFGQAQEKTYERVPELLLVEVEEADLEIVASDTDRVRVSREAAGGAGGDWELTGDTLTLEADCGVLSGCAVRYEVALPADTALSVRAANGATTVSGFTAPIEVATGNGAVRVSDSPGPLTLTSENGDLNVEGAGPASLSAATGDGSIDAAFAEEPSVVEVSTNNGDATVALPGGPYTVFETVGDGEVVIGVPVDEASDNTVSARTENGTITLVPVD